MLIVSIDHKLFFRAVPITELARGPGNISGNNVKILKFII